MSLSSNLVTPCVGVWIEIVCEWKHLFSMVVTPCVGVWIEIANNSDSDVEPYRHSLRGSVD